MPEESIFSGANPQGTASAASVKNSGRGPLYLLGRPSSALVSRAQSDTAEPAKLSELGCNFRPSAPLLKKLSLVATHVPAPRIDILLMLREVNQRQPLSRQREHIAGTRSAKADRRDRQGAGPPR